MVIGMSNELLNMFNEKNELIMKYTQEKERLIEYKQLLINPRISSYEVADMMKKEHSEVLVMIEKNILKEPVDKFYFIKTTDNEGKVYYECTKLGCGLLGKELGFIRGWSFDTKYRNRYKELLEEEVNSIFFDADILGEPFVVGRYVELLWVKNRIKELTCELEALNVGLEALKRFL